MSFFPEHIKMLLEEGHTVELACNDTVSKVPEVYHELGLKIHTIDFSRKPLSRSNATAYKQVKKLIKTGNYDLVHTHTPNASAIVRFVCRRLRKKGLKVFYTAHGFHFYRGAPLINWILYYPVEWLCSWWTDMLITINDEDYQRANASLNARNTVKINGIGMDFKKFINCQVDRESYRTALGLNGDDKILIYVGELNRNKNQALLLEMLAAVRRERKDVKLVLVGTGPEENALRKKTVQLGLTDAVIFTGFRTDIPELLKIADIAVPSSIREGLPMNVLESMASGLPIVACDNRGHRTIIEDCVNGFLVPISNATVMARRVLYLIEHEDIAQEMRKRAMERLNQYSSGVVVARMRQVYEL